MAQIATTIPTVAIPQLTAAGQRASARKIAVSAAFRPKAIALRMTAISWDREQR